MCRKEYRPVDLASTAPSVGLIDCAEKLGTMPTAAKPLLVSFVTKNPYP